MDFISGAIYRRRDLHAELGGQQQGGISTPTAAPILMLFTGESGERYGYADGLRDDGTFWYTGEGQVGDMQMVRGNRAIRDHEADGKRLHLFEQAHRGHVRYLGEAAYAGHHPEVAPDRDGNPRRAIVFELELEPTTEGVAPPLPEATEGTEGTGQLSLAELRAAALAEPPAGATPGQRKTTAYRRSVAVRAYVLRRAGGICEACAHPAPFTRVSGEPYLEPHHIRRLADRGPDHPAWVAAICPNCHRRVHSGADGAEYNQHIAARVAVIEQR
ncbi:MAG TPA: HNH endonuclease [Vicinamibacterales bacterium]|nr:HNH endonuclease [Vicinamibacterales bacterium]